MKQVFEGVRKQRTGVLLAVVFLILLTGCGKKGEEVVTGRYAEREIELQGHGYDRMFPFEDGGYAVTGAGMPVLLADAQGELRKVSDLWRNNVSMSKEISCTAAPDGGCILCYCPLLTEKEYEEQMDGGSIYRYLYVDKNGGRHMMEPFGEGYSKEEGDSLDLFAFSSDGKVYASEYQSGSVFRMDPETGKLGLLFAAGDRISEFCFLKGMLIALDSERAWIYDLEKGELLPENRMLNEFIKEHQVEGKSIVLCGEEREKDVILYLGCRTGLYRYIWDGSVIEQIADGQMLTFGNSYYEPQALQFIGDGEFRAFFKQDRLVELYYDENLPARPEKELSVYSLNEDNRIRYAAQLFQKKHPELLVKYETGIMGDNAVGTEDAVKNLNTKLLAGETPDILVLDGLDVEQYAKKGVLKKLDKLLQPYLEENLLFDNIAEGMRMTEEEGIYALPLMVMLPAWLAPRDYLEGEQNLDDIVAGMELAREEHPEQALLGIRSEEDLMQILIYTSLPEWTKKDGSLDVEKIREFYDAAKQLWALNDQGMSEQDWDMFREDFQSQKLRPLLGLSWNYRNSQSDNVRIWTQLGLLQCIGHDLSAVHLQILGDAQRAEMAGTEPEGLWFGPYNGQARNVFWGQTITGICEKAQEPELAAEFLELLLSDEVMNKWWLNDDTGIPVTRSACANCLDINNNDWNDYMGFMANSEIQWPNEEEQARFLEMMEAAAVFYQPGSALEEIAMEVGVLVCRDELTSEEGAAEVERRMAIAMEE